MRIRFLNLFYLFLVSKKRLGKNIFAPVFTC